MNDTSIQIWGADITTILKNFRKKYKKIFVVGHSFGGTALLFADSNFADGFIFLDATYVQAKDNWFGGVYYRQVKGYIVSGGISHFLSKKFVDTFNHFPDCGKCISQIHKPVCFIVAGRLGNMKAGKKYFAKANQPKKLITISGADHNFDNFKHEQKVFDVINWFIK